MFGTGVHRALRCAGSFVRRRPVARFGRDGHVGDQVAVFRDAEAARRTHGEAERTRRFQLRPLVLLRGFRHRGEVERQPAQPANQSNE